MSQPIPFHLTIQSSAVSLAAFLPFSPTANVNTLSQRKITRLQLMRQTTVDVRWVVWRFIYHYIALRARRALPFHDMTYNYPLSLQECGD